MISLRKMTLGSGYRYLMESVATGDAARRPSTSLSAYYAESGTPPGVFLGAGLPSLDGGRGVEKGSAVSEEHLFNMLGMCADPVSGQPLGRQPNRCPSVVGQAFGGADEGDHCPFRHRRAGRGAAPDGGRRAGSGGRDSGRLWPGST